MKDDDNNSNQASNPSVCSSNPPENINSNEDEEDEDYDDNDDSSFSNESKPNRRRKSQNNSGKKQSPCDDDDDSDRYDSLHSDPWKRKIPVRQPTPTTKHQKKRPLSVAKRPTLKSVAAVKEDPSKNSATLGLGTTTKQLPTKPEKALPKQPRRTASTATKKQRPTTSTSATTTALEEWDAYDIVWPLSNHSTLGLQQLETPDKDGITLLVQLDPDCPIPEFVGAVGAVGRLEATADHRVVLDLQGTQYTGQIYPGPTFMILTVTQDTHAANNKEDPNDTATPSPTPPYLKVEGMVDEFCRLVKTGNALDQMNATVQSGISLNNNTRDDSNDAEENNMRFSSYDDINVNHAPPSSKVGSASKASMASPAAASDNQKRPSSKTTTTATKRKKSKLK